MNPYAKDMTWAPARWNGDLGNIAVGAVDNDGTILDETQYLPTPGFSGTGPDAWAPGDIQACPWPGPNGPTVVNFPVMTSGGKYFLLIPEALKTDCF